MILYASLTSVQDMPRELFPVYPSRLLARYRYDTLASLADIACPVLIMHSAEDEIIPFSHGKALFEAAREPKHLLVLAGVSCSGRGTHLFGDQHEELRVVAQQLGDVPLVGFYADGEISGSSLYAFTGVLTVFY